MKKFFYRLLLKKKQEKKELKKFNKYLNIVTIFFFFLLFLFSIELLSTSFKSLSFDLAKNLINDNTSVFVGLLIGILATAIMQSSSATTSIIIGIFGSSFLSGDIEKTLFFIIPYIIGANIGTSITSLFVSFAHIKDKTEFRNAFSISTIHSLFNIILMIIIFPLQYYTNFLGKLSIYFSSFFYDKTFFNIGLKNPIDFIFQFPLNLLNNLSPYFLIVLSLIFIFFSLKYISIFLRQLFSDNIKQIIDKVIFKSKYSALTFGFFITLIIQSSSASTALLVPFAAIGLVKLNRAYPFILGSNVGTTITALLAALIIGTNLALAIAFSHMIFNILGIILLFVLPVARKFMYVLTEKILTLTQKYKYFPFIYVGGIYFIIPIIFIWFFG